MQPIQSLIPMVVTDRITETKEFYTRHFGLKVTFDCGWYFDLQAKGEQGSFHVAFREPREGEPTFGAGLTFALQVADADAEQVRLEKAGVPIAKPIGDNPWGDRSFLVRDPNGIGLYVFHPIESAPEFKQYVKD